MTPRPPRVPINPRHVLPTRAFMASVNSLIASHTRLLALLPEPVHGAGPVEIEEGRLIVMRLAALDAVGEEKGRAVTRPVVLA